MVRSISALAVPISSTMSGISATGTMVTISGDMSDMASEGSVDTVSRGAAASAATEVAATQGAAGMGAAGVADVADYGFITMVPRLHSATRTCPHTSDLVSNAIKLAGLVG
jgi:hypothetical protein